MINIDIKTHPNLYFDYRDSLPLLSSIKEEDYEYPEEVVNFHVYTEVRTEKELECIKSYFATQNLDRTRLIIWSDYDVSNQENLQPYKNNIDFRIYDPIKESKGTILEGKLDRILAKDDKYYLQSDLLRLVALYKYGGIWIDMDIILLRDFKPILDQEYLYQWGGDTDFAVSGCCATVISLKKGSELASKLLEEILNMPVIGGTTIWGKDLFAKVYQKYNFTIFPSTFFNIEWLISKIYRDLSYEIPTFWFENPCPDEYLFLECFAWHWHNSSNKGKNIVEGSKFDKLRKINESKLENGKLHREETLGNI